MKDGTTHLAHKAEHAVDLTSGALVAVTLQPASEGDTGTIHKTLEEAQTELKRLDLAVEEVVADKGYHSVAVLTELHEQEFRSYIPEPDRGRRKWEGDDKKEEQKRTYENRRRVRGDRSKRLQKLRSELTERTFAHLYETGGMRRVHLRGRDNILKRLVVNVSVQSVADIEENAGSGQATEVTGYCCRRCNVAWTAFLLAFSAVRPGRDAVNPLCRTKLSGRGQNGR
jgi:transposase